MSKDITNKTINHQCSRCGECCGLFIPFTDEELDIIKAYVKEHNIEPVNRIDRKAGTFKGHCCFYDEDAKKMFSI